MEPIDRIFLLADAKYKEQRDFASALGLNPSLVSQWRNGITKSYERRISQIADVLGTTIDYLLTGEEKKEPGATNGTELVLTQEEARFIGYLRQMTPDQRKALDKKLEFLISMQEAPPAGRE